MELRKDARVVSADGKDVGRVDRVVLDPVTRDVMQVVIRSGPLLAGHRVVPVERIAETTEQEVRLRDAAEHAADFPPFEETSYVRVAEDVPDIRSSPGVTYPQPLYWYPVSSASYGYLGNLAFPPPAYVSATERNIPEGAVPLREGARVVSREGKPVGHVEEIVTDERSRRARWFVISKGLFFKEEVRIPSSWIEGVEEDEVRLAVGEQTLESLGAPPEG